MIKIVKAILKEVNERQSRKISYMHDDQMNFMLHTRLPSAVAVDCGPMVNSCPLNLNSIR